MFHTLSNSLPVPSGARGGRVDSMLVSASRLRSAFEPILRYIHTLSASSNKILLVKNCHLFVEGYS